MTTGFIFCHLFITGLGYFCHIYLFVGLGNSCYSMHMGHQRTSEDNSWELVFLLFYHVGSFDPVQAVKIGSKYLYLLDHLEGPAYGPSIILLSLQNCFANFWEVT